MTDRVGAFKIKDAPASNAPRNDARQPAMKSAKRAPEPPHEQAAPPPKRQPMPARRSVAVGRSQGALALKDDPDWKEF